MHLMDAFVSESRLLELAVNIGGDHEAVETEAFAPVEEHCKSGMGGCFPVKVGAMAVESPAEGRVSVEVGRVGGAREADAEALVHRVGVPETLLSTEIGKAGINPHSRPGSDYQGAGPLDCFSSLSVQF